MSRDSMATDTVPIQPASPSATPLNRREAPAPRLSASIEKETGDVRSGEITLQLRLSNLGEVAIELFQLQPRVPAGVAVLEVRDSSHEETRERANKLLRELTQLVADYLLVESQEFREKQQQIAVDLFKSVVSVATSPFSFWRVYTNLLSGKLMRAQREARDRGGALKYEILSLADAERAEREFLQTPSSSASALIPKVYAAKLAQLHEIMEEHGDATGAGIALIEPGTTFTATYVLQCDRHAMSPRRLSFIAEIRYGARGHPERFSTETSCGLVVPPDSWPLALFAVAASVLGVTLRFALEQPQTGATEFFKKLGSELVTGPGLAAAILALVIYSVFEHTDIAKKSAVTLNWRTVLVIGVAAGIFGDRFLAAFRAFIGVP